MRIFAFLIVVSFAGLFSHKSVAADPKDIFGAILGEIGKQVQRQQERKLNKRLRPLWQACAEGNVAACDQAASFPLNRQGRQQLRLMRELAVERPNYERNWFACQKMEAGACAAALRYQGASENDRRKLRQWYRQANEKQQRFQAEQQRRLQTRHDCFARRLMSACSELLSGSSLSFNDKVRITNMRRELVAEEQRQRALDANRIAFQALARSCFNGQLVQCWDAISHPGANNSQRQRLIAHRDKLLADLESQRRKLAQERKAKQLQADCIRRNVLASCREALSSSALAANDRSELLEQFQKLTVARQQQDAAAAARKAERRRFVKLRTDCMSVGLKSACLTAASHNLATQQDRNEFEAKHYQLLSFPEQVMATVANAASDLNWNAPTRAVPLLPMLLGLAGGALLLGLTLIWFRRRQDAYPPEQRNPDPEEVSPPALATALPLTGHLPTDVRHVLYGS